MAFTKLEQVRQLRQEVVTERDKLTAALSKLDELIALLQGEAASKDNTKVAAIALVDKPRRTPGSSLSSPGIMQSAIALALAMYDEKPRFVKTGEVLERLIREGATVGGKSPSGNVSSYLKHSSELTNVRGYGWVRTRDIERWKQTSGPKKIAF